MIPMSFTRAKLLKHLSGSMRLSKLRTIPENEFILVVEELYDLWRSNRLEVKRDWGDSRQEPRSIPYTNRACFLPTDWITLKAKIPQQESIKIATWNVNSIRMRMPLVLSWLEEKRPDIVCLQETKVEDHAFPVQELELAGYRAVFSGQKSYNGVAILSRYAIEEVRVGFSNDYDPGNKRLIAARILGMWCINVYIPQGESTLSPKFAYKLEFLEELLRELESNYDSADFLLLAGDINIAPDERDLSNPEAMQQQVSFHPEEHQFLKKLRGQNFNDVFRQFHQEKGQYSWWDFRTRGFEKDEGMRIDHIWVSPALLTHCQSCVIDVNAREQPKPSDHAPVLAEIQFPVTMASS